MGSEAVESGVRGETQLGRCRGNGDESGLAGLARSFVRFPDFVASAFRHLQIIRGASELGLQLDLAWSQTQSHYKHIVTTMASHSMNTTRLLLRLRPNTPSNPTSTLLPRSPQLPLPRARTAAYSTRLTTEHLPRIAQPSLWNSLIPKSFRNRTASSPASSETSKEWNPASFYIIIFILIGSQAIRMIMLRNDYNAYTRSTDAKIRLLKEVIGKVQRGEDVDVEKLLGTGDQSVEREWDEVLREIEREDSLWHQKQKRAAEEQTKAEAEAAAQEQTNQDPVAPAVDETDQSTAKDNATKRKVSFF
ncbi:DUF5321 domain-containing protein [Aspergillus mulundensis]|uniref:Uncharacterized protein n=1 Tax=Aspergillus mulundensis TaxID=1810919 RepID=A0A3D8QJI6_9EURO|nr:Uncharacterized protein DSM5745_10512 [Aspergillus mulundensis]RDW61840.1 Uncharacterized protein DSM5745_10512 [Aspergillus mulundensis]